MSAKRSAEHDCAGVLEVAVLAAARQDQCEAAARLLIGSSHQRANEPAKGRARMTDEQKRNASGASLLSEGLAADLRTKIGQELSVIKQIRDDGGFSIFWATETQRRACAIERLQKRGEIRRVGGDYPFCKYELAAN